MRTTCTCKPVKAGEPFRPDWNGCDCHTESRYVCERTGCTDYRPIRDWDPSLMRGVSSFPPGASVAHVPRTTTEEAPMTKPLFRTLPKHVQHMLRRRNREWIQDTQGDDELAWRAATAARIAELAEDGRVAVVYWGMDCDCSRWDDRVRILPARLREVMRWVDDYDRGAEGPQGWRLSRPSEAPTRSRSRDLALEAFEDGHPHIVYP